MDFILLQLWIIILLVVFIVFVLFYRTGLHYNEADWGNKVINSIDGLIRLLCYTFHRLDTNRIELPGHGSAIIVSNHISGLDPLLMIAASNRPIRFLIAREEYNRFGLRWLFRAAGCIPVDRSGQPERALREARRALAMGEVVGLFPHGRIHLDSDPPRALKAGAAKLAKVSGVAIYPCRIEGVKGAGHTLLSLLWRSKVSMRVFSPIQCDAEVVDCMESLAQLLNSTIDSNLSSSEAVNG